MKLEWIIKNAVKAALNDNNNDDYGFVTLPDGGVRYMTKHDALHVEVANLPPILMGKDMVNGIDGIDMDVFHDQPFTARYNGYLDEARVGVHQCMTTFNLMNVVRAGYWCAWLALHGINPVAVCVRQYMAMGK